MALFLEDELGLWDSVGEATKHDCFGLDYVQNEWENKEKLVDYDIHVKERVEEPFSLDKQLELLDGLDVLGDDSAFESWMEDKFDFDECNMTLNSLEDVEKLLKENPYEQIYEFSHSEENSTLSDEQQVSQEIPDSPPQVEVEIGPSCEQVLINLIVTDVSKPEKKKKEREKPYSRGNSSKRRANNTENKKSRKRNQNRDAATRYRLKKKEEANVLLEEEERLTTINAELSKKVENLSTEINYLKSLMKELLQAKKK